MRRSRKEIEKLKEEARRLAQEGVPKSEISKRLGISLATVYRYLKEDSRPIVAKEDHIAEDTRETILEDLESLIKKQNIIKEYANRLNLGTRPLNEELPIFQELKRIFPEEMRALGFWGILLENMSDEARTRHLADLNIDEEELSRIKNTIYNLYFIVPHAKYDHIKVVSGKENEWRRINVRRWFEWSRGDPMIELEIVGDLSTFKTRDSLDSYLRLLVRLLLEAGVTLRWIQRNRIKIDREDLEEYEKHLSVVQKVVNEALNDIEQLKKL